MLELIRRMFGSLRRTALRNKTASRRRAPTAQRPCLEPLEQRDLPATLMLPNTDVPTFTATFNMTEPGVGPVQVSGEPVAGGNFLGTLDGHTQLSASYCVRIDLNIFPTTYNHATVTSNGTIYGAHVPNAGAISWLLTNLGPTATTPIRQDALQAAIWRTEYGNGFQFDGVDNDNGAPAINSTIAPIYRADLAALGHKTAPVNAVAWISPGANPDSSRAQGLVALTPDLAVSHFSWLPIKLGTDTAAKVAFDIRSQGYTGPVRATIYQSPDGVRREGALATTILNVKAGTLSAEQLAIAHAPVPGPNPFVRNAPNFLLLDVEPQTPFYEANKANNVVTLRVAEPQALSIELEGHAPIANTRAERVALWLAANATTIRTAATHFNVPASAIAGAIAWEALFNVATIKTYQGPGKVHPISNQLGLPSAAEQVEELGLLPRVNLLAREQLVQITYSAVQYIAAILDSYALAAEKAGSHADIRHNPGVLVTFYNGVSKPVPSSAGVHPYYATSPFSHSTWILPLNAEAWFHYSIHVLHHDTYSPDPSPSSMGSWVQANVRWLAQAVEMP